MSESDKLLTALDDVLDKYGVISEYDRENIYDISKKLISSADNLMSHKHSWCDALARLIELEPESATKEYWEHELNAMKYMYDELERIAKP